MKGVIVAGGLGTRLRPLTLITNKHLLPVYDKPMVLYPLATLKTSGITEIMVVCGKEHAGDFVEFLGSGKEYGVTISYAQQDTNNGGIADALRYAEDFADGSHVAVVLGDNIFEDDFRESAADFAGGGMVFLKEVTDPSRFGVAVFDDTGKKIVRIEEKPKEPKSNFAQTGFYLFDKRIFSVIKELKPSHRGELEITDAVNTYIEWGELAFSHVKGFWSDAGTFDTLLRAGSWAAERKQP